MSTNKSQPSVTNAAFVDVVEEISGALLELDEIMDGAFAVARRAGDVAAQLYALQQVIKEYDKNVDLGKSQ